MKREFVTSLLIGVLTFILGFVNPAYAGESQDQVAYIAADGRDLTAVVKCLPEQLSQPNLDRALQESGNDFLEKVFSLKDNYGDYKLDETEVAFITCLNQQGVTPQVER